MKVGILLIATNKYNQFVAPLLKQLEENFLPEHERYVILYTDKPPQQFIQKEGFKIIPVTTHSYKYPEVTLFRFKFFTQSKQILQRMDYLFYMDVDCAVPERIGEEILNPLTVVHHCGFYKNNGWGSPNVDAKSTAYFDQELRKEYVMGGFNGGEAKEFLTMAEILYQNIEADEKNNVRAEWFDESHINFYISNIADREKVKVLPPSFCMVENMTLRKAWGIDDLIAKIIALDKDHAKIRE